MSENDKVPYASYATDNVSRVFQETGRIMNEIDQKNSGTVARVLMHTLVGAAALSNSLPAVTRDVYGHVMNAISRPNNCGPKQ